MDRVSRESVKIRANFRCEYCRIREADIPFPTFHIEHIRPIKHGGTDEGDNLCFACPRCNLHKSSNLTGIDPETDEITVIFNPRVDEWESHFEFIGPRLAGKTDIGRTTIRVCNINYAERINLRLEILERGEELG